MFVEKGVSVDWDGTMCGIVDSNISHVPGTKVPPWNGSLAPDQHSLARWPRRGDSARQLGSPSNRKHLGRGYLDRQGPSQWARKDIPCIQFLMSQS